ncbi:MAG: hypothetical protein MJ252_13890 [archaeon]|nr:hypothetical protein [archaeon]
MIGKDSKNISINIKSNIKDIGNSNKKTKKNGLFTSQNIKPNKNNSPDSKPVENKKNSNQNNLENSQNNKNISNTKSNKEFSKNKESTTNLNKEVKKKINSKSNPTLKITTIKKKSPNSSINKKESSPNNKQKEGNKTSKQNKDKPLTSKNIISISISMNNKSKNNSLNKQSKADLHKEDNFQSLKTENKLPSYNNKFIEQKKNLEIKQKPRSQEKPLKRKNIALISNISKKVNDNKNIESIINNISRPQSETKIKPNINLKNKKNISKINSSKDKNKKESKENKVLINLENKPKIINELNLVQLPLNLVNKKPSSRNEKKPISAKTISSNNKSKGYNNTIGERKSIAYGSSNIYNLNSGGNTMKYKQQPNLSKLKTKSNSSVSNGSKVNISLNKKVGNISNKITSNKSNNALKDKAINEKSEENPLKNINEKNYEKTKVINEVIDL